MLNVFHDKIHITSPRCMIYMKYKKGAHIGYHYLLYKVYQRARTDLVTSRPPYCFSTDLYDALLSQIK